MVRLILAAAAALAWLAAPALAEDEKYYKIVHAETGKVLAVADNSGDAGARIVLAKGDGSEGQQWKIVKAGDHLMIVNRKSGKVLDVNEASADEGAEIIQWDEKTEDNDNQRWSWVVTDKAKQLKSKSSGHVLAVNEDKVVQKKADDKAKGQMWEAVEVAAK